MDSERDKVGTYDINTGGNDCSNTFNPSYFRVVSNHLSNFLRETAKSNCYFLFVHFPAKIQTKEILAKLEVD